YLVTVSSRLTAGNQETVCALIQTPTEPVTLTITLDLDSSSTKIGELSFQTEIYRCFQFMVPMVSSTTVGSISVKIRGRVDVTTKETKVLIEPPAFIHIVQTDKPIYKPGQTVQFRIVSMDTNFIPVSRQYIIKQDPNSNRIAQWLNESIDGGILDLSHPTIPEAAQGIYVITAETDKGETISYNFEIKEYVLPKFEVTVNLPSVITILDEEVTIEICGNICHLPFISAFSSLYISILILQIKVVGADGSPVVFHAVYLYIKDSLAYTFYTDQNGIATFSLDTSLWSESLGTPKTSESDLNQTSICDKLGMRMCCITLFFTVSPVNKGYVRISLKNVMDLAPVAQVVLNSKTRLLKVKTSCNVQQRTSYCVLTSLCALMSPVQVSLEFSATQELPGAKTTLTLQAQPSSLCSVRAIDQSVLLLKSEKELTTDYVYNQLPVQKMWGYDYRIEDRISCSSRPWEIARIGWNAIHRARRDRNSRMILPIPEGDDVRTVFKVIRFFNRICHNLNERDLQIPLEGRVMKFEKSSGSTSLEKTVPDTITKWAAGAFCVSPAGFGVAPNVGLTAFQPFFVSLTLPYSVVRGEVFTLKATVFNYLPKCIMVNSFSTSEQASVSVESKTFSWIVTPTALGSAGLKSLKRDHPVSETEKITFICTNRFDCLFLQAEGVPQMVSYNALLCPANGPVSKNISLELPEEFVTGSERASVSVLGDLMGRAMKNLDKLLAMPYGCGEQNMLLFAPNIFILDYLKSTGQLKDSTLKTAVGYLESGYQRELNYKHDDGSYSAFGMSDASGNTWLTTFVMKSFNAAKSYIFVDQKYVQDARTWLSGLQKPDGCIQSVGRLFHNGMKGGVSDDVSLTAYVAAAMLELDGNADDPVVQNCLKCLQSAAEDNITNLYTVALMSYTFTLAGDEDMRSKLITQLDEESTNEGKTKDQDLQSYLDSVEVEMTSYVLLALLSGPSLPDFGLDYAAGIVRWLAQQQNPFGGFSSTQDTVVALQALAKYASATYSPEGSTTVTVTSAGGLNKQFTINNENRLLYQEEKLSEIPGEYTIKAEGQSCVLAQISLFYNIPPPSDFSAFQISTDTRGRCDLPRPEFMLFVHGRREETNMVVINIKLLSGYILQDDSLKMVTEHPSMLASPDQLFCQEVVVGPKMPGSDQQVENLKPAVVKVYDYYQTSRTLC
uniref:Alpha-2-macroglobulin-like 1 n=1 Tax=Oryzias melastigma TaxID=30732 RepID=A0A3B3DTU1_ORYME